MTVSNNVIQPTGVSRIASRDISEIRVARHLKIALCGFFGSMAFGSLFLGARVRTYFVPSGSMENTLKIGDRIMVNESAYDATDPKDGEVVIFRAPRAALLNSDVANEKVVFVKRVVGCPGQVVEVINRKLRVNGALVSEPFTKWSDELPAVFKSEGESAPRYSYDMKVVGDRVYSREYVSAKQPGPWSANGVIVREADQEAVTKAKAGKIPTGQYLVLGDHRNNSNDSHVFGFVARSLFRGRALNVFWPLSHRKSLIGTPSVPTPH